MSEKYPHRISVALTEEMYAKIKIISGDVTSEAAVVRQILAMTLNKYELPKPPEPTPQDRIDTIAREFGWDRRIQGIKEIRGTGLYMGLKEAKDAYDESCARQDLIPKTSAMYGYYPVGRG